MHRRFVAVLPVVGLLLAAVVALRPCTAFACSCTVPGAPDVELSNATAVFAGRVVSVAEVNRATDGLPMSRQVRFEVSRTWKGPAAASIEVVTGQGDGDCGFGFEPGGEYLVYAHASDGYLYTGLCSRTASLADAGEDLAAIGEGSAQLPAGVTGPVADGEVRPAAGQARPGAAPAAGFQLGQRELLLALGALVLIGGAVAALIVVRRRA